MLFARVRGWIRAQEVSADYDFGLNHGLSAEDDVRCPNDLGAPRDLVARVLWRGELSDIF